ncbi:rho GDP-dissociation inhibitor 1 isoform X2 [Zea mays]|nr:rho GDP-dissociation inhibitor 1 isoform X2 [Zea mays]|eukprot:XP_008643852.1 rho GDP-dissociation inhibitor 1 isoform X2 [Zea mays]
MSSAVEAISCPKVDVPAGPEPGEPAKEAAPPAEHCDTAPNGKCAPRCHGEEEEEEEDEEDEEKAPKAIDLGPMVSIKEQLEKDKDDESLRRWKEQLLGGVDLNSVGDLLIRRKVQHLVRCTCNTQTPNIHTETLEPDVKIMSLSILSPGRPDIVLPLPVEPNGKGVWFTLKEGSPYRLKFTFSVSNNIVSGLRYTNTVWKTGLKVDRAKEMLGTFSPQLEPYTYVTPEDTTPSGMFARGSYSARTKFLDDDRKCYLEINYTFDIRREWPSTS